MRQLPVALMRGSRRSATRRSATSVSAPMIRLNTSAASPLVGRKMSCVRMTSVATRLHAIATSGVSRLGFHRVALPQMPAIIAFHAHTAAGKLKAVMQPTVPSGCHCSYMRCVRRSLCMVSP